MKSDRVSGTPNQITPTDEIMPDLNHSGIYNTQKKSKDFMRENLIFESCGARMSNNEYKVNKEG